MTNKCDFSFRHYEECMSMISASNKDIELIHDVDHLTDNLDHIVRTEYYNGISSTFFMRVHAKNYNAFSHKTLELIRKVKNGDIVGSQAKHLADFGLHFEPTFYDEINQKRAIALESATMGLNYDHQINKVSIHEPARFGMINESRVPSGMVLYGYGSEYYKDKKYISDSGGRWREGCMCQHIDKHEKLIILTHPIWWYNQTSAENY